jgi:hypothetical protein
MQHTRLAIQLVALIFRAGIGFASQHQTTPPPKEQTAFSEQDPMQHTVPLPPEVLGVLLRTKEAKSILGGPKSSKSQNAAKMFRASEIHLSDSNRVDMIVMGVFPMIGADNDWYWFVRDAYGRPRVILFEGCNSIGLTDSETNGFKNIESAWSSASEDRYTEFHFDGYRYKIWKRTYESRF